jgi:hypothetical protein
VFSLTHVDSAGKGLRFPRRECIVLLWWIGLLAGAILARDAHAEEAQYDVVDKSTTRWIIDSYNPKFVRTWAATHQSSYEVGGLVAIGLICGDRQFFPKRFTHFKIAVPLPGDDKYLLADLDSQDVLLLRNMKDSSQVTRYLLPSVKKVGKADIPKGWKRKKSR